MKAQVVAEGLVQMLPDKGDAALVGRVRGGPYEADRCAITVGRT